jgi:hypothetical protein
MVFGLASTAAAAITLSTRTRLPSYPGSRTRKPKRPAPTQDLTLNVSLGRAGLPARLARVRARVKAFASVRSGPGPARQVGCEVETVPVSPFLRVRTCVRARKFCHLLDRIDRRARRHVRLSTRASRGEDGRVRVLRSSVFVEAIEDQVARDSTLQAASPCTSSPQSCRMRVASPASSVRGVALR